MPYNFNMLEDTVTRQLAIIIVKLDNLDGRLARLENQIQQQGGAVAVADAAANDAKKKPLRWGVSFSKKLSLV